MLREPDLPLIRSQLESIYASGIRSVAVVFMHSYAFAEHERAVGQLARELGFEQVSVRAFSCRIFDFVWEFQATIECP